jgi:hypothetical protein
MASEKQIAANRGNARLSTGPKTMDGRLRSSANAFQHGLSRPLQTDSAEVDAMATWLISGEADFARLDAAQELALTELDLQRIRRTRFQIIASCFQRGEFHNLERLAALDRYERAARVKRKRAVQCLEK